MKGYPTLDRASSSAPAPLQRSYWVTESLLAGVYPGSILVAEAEEKMRALRVAGVTLFVDLTDRTDALEPYEHLLVDPVRRIPLPVHDLTVPPPAVVAQALQLIDAETTAGGICYVHCWGGIGRTGTIVGCWLAERVGGTEALARLAELRAGCTNADAISPSTAEERTFVEAWPRARRRLR
jgi:protein-tyrosine phosphatase